MKKIISLSLVFVMLFSFTFAVNANDYTEGKNRGKRDAQEKHSAMGYWIAGGVGSFFLSPLLGGGATIITSYVQEPSPDNEIIYRLREEKSQNFIDGYRDGYTEKAKSKNVTGAWASTGIAFLGRLVIITSVNNSTYDTTTYSGTNNHFQPQNTIPVVNFSF